MTTYYTVTGNPISLSRGASSLIRAEYTLVQTGFATVNTEMVLKAPLASPTFTGVPAAPTAAFGTNTTQLATTAFVTGYYAPIASPTFTGTPVAPTAALGTSTTQLATTAFAQTMQDPAFTGTPTVPTASAGTATTQIASCAFVVATSFSAALPGQTGNSGKFVTTDGSNASWASVYPTQTSNSGKFLQTNGTTTAWAFAGVSQVTTATTATTMTSTPTLLKITPASYGVTVTLPDATTCSVGGPLHIIDNRGAYPVRVCDSTGVLKAFVFAGVVSHISLDDNSTAAGVWAIENGELVGASAQLLTTSLAVVTSCIALDSDRELILGAGTNPYYGYAVVYNKTTNTFGTPTLLRSVSLNANGYQIQGVLSATDQVLVVSCNNGPLFEAVTLSISGTTITVNTAATATLSANISSFAAGCGLIAVGSSFVTSYTVATPAAQIRALSISGTTVTIGSATVLDGTAGGLIAASTNHVIAVSSATTHFYTKPYLVSGSTLTAGTGTDSGTNTVTIYKFAPLGTRWVGLYLSNYTIGGVVSLNTTGNGTTTISNATLFTAGTFLDAILVGSTKVLALNSATSSNANILTDTAGTASAGTAITLSSQTTRACLYASGTDVAVQEGTTTYLVQMVDCSGASPVRTKTITTGGSNVEAASFAISNAMLSRSPNAVYGTAYARNVWMGAVTQNFDAEVRGGVFSRKVHTNVPGDNTSPGAAYRGTSAANIWIADASTVITKLEAA